MWKQHIRFGSFCPSPDTFVDLSSSSASRRAYRTRKRKKFISASTRLLPDALETAPRSGSNKWKENIVFGSFERTRKSKCNPNTVSQCSDSRIDTNNKMEPAKPTISRCPDPRVDSNNKKEPAKASISRCQDSQVDSHNKIEPAKPSVSEFSDSRVVSNNETEPARPNESSSLFINRTVASASSDVSQDHPFDAKLLNIQSDRANPGTTIAPSTATDSQTYRSRKLDNWPYDALQQRLDEFKNKEKVNNDIISSTNKRIEDLRAKIRGDQSTAERGAKKKLEHLVRHEAQLRVHMISLRQKMEPLERAIKKKEEITEALKRKKKTKKDKWLKVGKERKESRLLIERQLKLQTYGPTAKEHDAEDEHDEDGASNASSEHSVQVIAERKPGQKGEPFFFE